MDETLTTRTPVNVPSKPTRRRCFPFSHDWSLWETISEYYGVYSAIIQKRTCMRCGKEKIRRQSV